MRREVDLYILWLLIAAGGHEKGAWTSWKTNKLHSTKRTTEKSLISFPQPDLALTSFPLSNTVKNGNRENFWTSSWIRTEKNPRTFRGEKHPHSPIISLLLACESEIKFMAQNDWHFNNKLPRLWLDKCSLKEGFDRTWERTSALWSFVVSVATKYD